MAGPAVDRVTKTYMAPRHGHAEPPWAPQQPPPSAGPLHDEASPATAITADCRTELGPAAVGSFARSSRGVALQGDLGSVWPWLGVRGRDAGVWLTSYFPTTSPSPNVELRTTRKRIHPAAASPGALAPGSSALTADDATADCGALVPLSRAEVLPRTSLPACRLPTGPRGHADGGPTPDSEADRPWRRWSRALPRALISTA